MPNCRHLLFFDQHLRKRSEIAAVRDFYNQLEPFTGGYYDNIDFGHSDEAANYGPAHARLSEIKAQHDPGNMFRLNSNIRPAV